MIAVVGGQDYYDLCDRAERGEIHIEYVDRGKTNGDWIVTYSEFSKLGKDQQTEEDQSGYGVWKW